MPYDRLLLHGSKELSPSEPQTAARRQWLYWAVSLSLAAVLLAFSLRGIEWTRVGELLGRAHWGYTALVLALATGNLFLRSVRWRVLLTAAKSVSVSAAFWATAAGYFGNNLLPARAGEIVRTVFISTRSHLSKTYVLTTALAERVADAIALVAISSLVLLTLPNIPGWLARAARPFGLAGLAGVVLLAVAPWLEPLGERWLAPLPMPPRLRSKLGPVVREALLGIRSFHHPVRLGAFLLLTAVIWCADAVGAVLGARTIGLTMSLPVAFLLIAGLGLGSALPSTPGYVGIYQFVAVSVLVPFGFSRTDAIAYILFAQAVSYVVFGSWGLTGLLQYRRLRQL